MSICLTAPRIIVMNLYGESLRLVTSLSTILTRVLAPHTGHSSQLFSGANGRNAVGFSPGVRGHPLVNALILGSIQDRSRATSNPKMAIKCRRFQQTRHHASNNER